MEEKGIIRDYCVFPSISWEPKGMRLARLVKAVQFRAPTIMFIDDNPTNWGEAAAAVPGLQVEDENFIPKMLDDPRFKGKDDRQLTRLKQYQLLEQRQHDEELAGGGNEEFLRGCDLIKGQSSPGDVVRVITCSNEFNKQLASTWLSVAAG